MVIDETDPTYENINTPVEPETHIDVQDNQETQESNSKPIKKKNTALRAISELRALHEAVNSSVTPEEDNFDVFGKNIAMQLRKLSAERALICQARIQNILTEIGIEQIRHESSCSSSNISVNYILPQTPTPAQIACPSTDNQLWWMNSQTTESSSTTSDIVSQALSSITDSGVMID